MSDNEISELFAVALDQLASCQGGQIPALGPTAQWKKNFSKFDEKLRARPGETQAFELLKDVTRSGFYAASHRAGTPECRLVTDLYLRWLHLSGYPLFSFPKNLEESRLVDPSLGFDLDGRYASSMFLYHLCMFARLEKIIGLAGTVLEIGGGYGGFARLVKLQRPLATYVIVDLPQSLFFSSLFLKSSFPQAKILYARSSSEIVAWTQSKERYDFVFVPAALAKSLAGQMIDVVVSSRSLGEMTRESVDFYMDLIQKSANVRYLYTVERLGGRPGESPLRKADGTDGEDAARTCLKLDAGWDVLLWDAWGGASFSEIDPGSPPSLEILLRRNEALKENKELRRSKAYWLYRAAAQCLDRHSDWTYFLWDSVRLYPLHEPARLLAEHMKKFEWPEYRHFEKLAAAAGEWVPNAPESPAPIGVPPYPSRSEAVPGDVRFQIEASRMEGERRDIALMEAIAARSKAQKASEANTAALEEAIAARKLAESNLKELAAQRELELTEMLTRGKVIEALTQKIADLEKAKTAPDA